MLAAAHSKNSCLYTSSESVAMKENPFIDYNYHNDLRLT